MPPLNDKNTLRALTVGARKHFRRELVEFVTSPDGALVLAGEADAEAPRAAVFEVVQPTVAERAELFRRVGITSEAGAKDVDLAALAVEGILLCVKVPALDAEGNPTTGGTEPLFTAHDRESLRGQPAGGWIDVLAGRVQAILAAGASAGKA